jgi:protein ImuB
MPRVMCVHFPSWSLQRSRQQRPDLQGEPLAIVRPVARGGKVIACCGMARGGGVRPGMLQAESLAVLPELTCLDEDLDADREALARLAEWAQRFSPIVGIEDAIAPTCLFLDTTGCADCLGGEEAMIQRACTEFSDSGWTVVIALADTLGAAWGVSHFPRLIRPGPGLAVCGTHEGSLWVIVANDRHEACLAGLPIAALRLPESTIATLAQLGIEWIEQLAALPRGQIVDRLGTEVGLRLDQASGRAAEVIAPFHGEPEAAVSWAFDDPVERREMVAQVVDLLLERLQGILEKRCRGTRLVECTFEQEGAPMQRLECSLSRPVRLASYLRPLLRTRLEQMQVEAPIRAIGMRALVLERMTDESGELFDEAGADSEAALAHLLDSLVSRLGKEAVTKARAVADPQPELACRFECALQSSPPEAGAEQQSVFAHRPLRLLPRPLAIDVVALVPSGAPRHLHHAGADHAVAWARGPERIETGWWRGADICRDYYVVETTEGTRWWIFQRLGDGRWFLHGCFD